MAPRCASATSSSANWITRDAERWRASRGLASRVHTTVRMHSWHITLRPIGIVRSTLVDRKGAPRQPDEGAPPASIEVGPERQEGLEGIAAGDRIVLITWLDRTNRETLRVQPRGERALQGVFSTRSPDRPNPIAARGDGDGPGRPANRCRWPRGDRRDADSRHQARAGAVHRRSLTSRSGHPVGRASFRMLNAGLLAQRRRHASLSQVAGTMSQYAKRPSRSTTSPHDTSIGCAYRACRDERVELATFATWVDSGGSSRAAPHRNGVPRNGPPVAWCPRRRGGRRSHWPRTRAPAAACRDQSG